MTQRTKKEEGVPEATSNSLSTAAFSLEAMLHEIAQPLSAIMGYGSLVDPKETSGDTKEYVREMVSAAHFAGEIIDTVKRSAKGVMAPIDLPQIVRRARMLFCEQAVIIQVHETALPRVLGNTTMLQQVFVNLFRNAIEACSESESSGGGVDVRFLETENEVGISVDDDGPGVPANEVERIFTRIASKKESGSGIGLSICKWIVRQHHGQLRHIPNQPRGSRFQVWLPKATEQQQRSLVHGVVPAS